MSLPDTVRGDVYIDTDQATLSVVDRRPDSPDYGRVLTDTDRVRIHNAEPVVSETKRREAVRTDVTNGHAKLRGLVTPDPDGIDRTDWQPTTYRRDRPGCFRLPDSCETLLRARVMVVTLVAGVPRIAVVDPVTGAPGVVSSDLEAITA